MERALRLQAKPEGRTPEGRIHALNQLRRLVERGVSKPELRQILEQLRTLARSALPPSVVRPPPPAPRPVAAPYYNQHPPFPPQAHAPPPRPYSHPPPLSFNSIPQAVAVAPPQASVPALLPTNLESLMASLVKSGVLSVPGTSTPTSQVKGMNTREYRNFILSEPIASPSQRQISLGRDLVLWNYCMNGRHHSVNSVVYDLQIPSLEGHPGMLFRHIPRWIKGEAIAGASVRRVAYVALPIMRKGNALPNSSSLTSTRVDDAKRKEERHTQFVVIPLGSEAQSASCPI
ncbi:hypothetical protein CPB83DRAFT_905954 [Crepidotus variabilis]|uniref:Uncharacterized protein n=1 Tax=Crepidotus variabilis TaxID=179855 RepID=A0A9P6EIL1_9AGAR|nr:hypothetical protein CPB83DRAFT_905954 [Crepidotus variabilis]